jgi:hypothetical protein
MEKLYKVSKEWGYCYESGIHSKKNYWKDKNILDIGMGQGPHAVYYMYHGAKSYTGVDPDMKLDGSLSIRNHSVTDRYVREKFPYSPIDIMNIIPNVNLYPKLLEELDKKEHGNKYDIIIMTMVTEHLENNIDVISTCYDYLNSNGQIWSSHANYYHWNGHHEYPRNLTQWDKNNSEHNKYVDWKHLDCSNKVFYDITLNRIRIKDLKKIFNKYFHIIEWDKDIDNSVRDRLTDEIKNKYFYLDEEDFLSCHPIMYGKKRDKILDTDLSTIEYHHPITPQEKNIKNLIIKNDLVCTTYPNNRYNLIYQKHLFESIEYKNNELNCELIEHDSNINIKQFNSLGINFRLYQINLIDYNEYKFIFKMKANCNSTIGKNPKIYSGIKWILFDNPLQSDYQTYEIIIPFKFSTTSKFRLGIADLTFNDSFSIKDIELYKK